MHELYMNYVQVMYEEEVSMFQFGTLMPFSYIFAVQLFFM